MGSYLCINGLEITSKSRSHIIIELIRDLDLQFKGTHYNYFIPEDRNKEGVGIGKWTISRKGLAIIIDDIKMIMNNEDILERIVKDEYDYVLSKLITQEEKNDFVKDHLKEAKDEVEACLFFLIDVLTNSILEEKRNLKLYWV